jgi:hypothetical protein
LKNILLVTYSQTGQVSDIAAQLVAPLAQAGHRVHVECLQPATPFPWPWRFIDFIDVFPECVQLDAAPNRPLAIEESEEFDLVILAYQVWYLSPSLPMTAFLQSAEGQRLIAGKPVITLVACRNMWLTAQSTMRRLIAAAGGRLIDHLAFVDRAPALATFITTPRWVLTGRRDAFLGLPPAGVAAAEVRAARRYGEALDAALARDAERGAGPLLAGLGAAVVDPRLIISERAGSRAFAVWSRIIRACGKRGQWRRRPALLLFTVYLVLMILTVVPVSLLLQRLLAPVLAPRLQRLKQELEQPSGSAGFRLGEHVR